jgi:hypothetical protein
MLRAIGSSFRVLFRGLHGGDRLKHLASRGTSLGLVAALLFWAASPLFQVAEASGLLNISNTMSTLRQSVAANHTIIFRTPAGVDASTDTITITFPSGFAMGTVAHGDIDFASSAGGQTSCPAALAYTEENLAATAAAGVWGAAVSGQVLTLTAPTNAAVGEVPTNACVRIRIGNHATHQVAGVNRITNPTAGTYSIDIAGTFGNTGSVSVTILTDDTVAATATVPTSLTFSISDTTIGFGTLSTSASRFATDTAAGSGTEVQAHDIVAGTNAASGYVITVSGTTLTSGSFTINAIGATNTAPTPGTEQYGIRATATGGSGVVAAPYDGTGFALDTAAFPDLFASAPGATANTTFSVRYVANIAANTEAGVYTSSLTYLATATF